MSAQRPKRHKASESSFKDITLSFRQAFQLHRAGNLDAAKELYLAILRVSPQHGDSLHMLAAMALLKGEDVEALTWIETALSLLPRPTRSIT